MGGVGADMGELGDFDTVRQLGRNGVEAVYSG